MRHMTTKKFLAGIMTLIMLFSCFGFADAVDFSGSGIVDANDSVTSEAADSQTIDPNEETIILIGVEGDAALKTHKNIDDALKAAPGIKKMQEEAVELIEKAIGEEITVMDSYTLLYNGFTIMGTYSMVDRLNAIDGITASVPAKFSALDFVDGGDIVTPRVNTSTGTIGAQQAWQLGYTGEGSAIAVIDTGIRATHEAFSIMPENGKITEEYLSEVISEHGDIIHFGSSATQLYINEKLPFNWDYYDNNYDPNHTSSDHGTHVSGIAAGHSPGGFKGTAPDAQLVTMQVFDIYGSAYFTTLLLALEDCVVLGVDAINMSLGTPGGFTDPSYISDDFANALDLLEAAGIPVIVAAGNDANTLLWTNYGDNRNRVYAGLAANPDYGIVGAPATFGQAFAVGSIRNTSAETSYLTVGDHYFYPASVTGSTDLGALAGSDPTDYPIVYAGYCSQEELAELDVEGAIVLARRGNNITFTDKCTWAADAGAAGIIIFNNTSGDFSPSVVSPIPLGTLSQASGEEIISLLTDGVNGTCTLTVGTVYEALSMSSTSSWGTTADLKIKPEIVAPGDNINSAIGFGSDMDYGNKSGTSMATPQIAAAMAIIRERVAEVMPNATAEEINKLAYSFAMSTAHQVNGFVRQQGAGVIDIASAVTTEAYLSVPGCDRPKLEIGENEEGTFTFTFNVNNFGDSELTYSIVPYVMTDSATDGTYDGPWHQPSAESIDVKLVTGSIFNVTNLVDITAPDTVTVPAGESVEIEMTIAATEALMDYIHENFSSGIYLEGFIKLEAITENTVDLSIPFLGFVGDWDYAAMFDRGYYWQYPTGEINMQQHYTCLYNFAGYTAEQGLGLNRYADMTGHPFIPDRGAISPNGDGLYDSLSYIEFALLRGAKELKVYVENAEGQVIQTIYEGQYAIKNHFWDYNYAGTLNKILPDFTGANMSEGETVYVVVEAWLDHEGYLPENNENGRWIIPVTKDTQVPGIAVSESGIEIIDEQYIAYIGIYSDEEMQNALLETGVFAEQRAEAYAYDTELTELYVKVADYAGNETTYHVDRETGIVYDLDISVTDFGRQINGYSVSDYTTYSTQKSWISFMSNVPAGTIETLKLDGFSNSVGGGMGQEVDIYDCAVTPDGTIYACDMPCNLFTIDPETFERSEPIFNGLDAGGFQLRNLMVHPETGELYCMYCVNGWQYNFGKVDLENRTIEWMFTINEFCWAMDFLDKNTLISYDGNDLRTYDLSGNNIDTIELGAYLGDPTQTGGNLSWAGYTGSLLYEEETNSVYCTSYWGWLYFGERSGSGGMFKFDLDTNTMSLHTFGDARGGGRFVMGLYFADEAGNQVPTPLEDFSLSCDTLDVDLYGTSEIEFIRNPVDANLYELEWSSEDESIATVDGNKVKATVEGVGIGTTTIVCTVLVDGEVFGTAEAEVNVVPNEALNEAANAEGSNIIVGSPSPYPFIPVQGEDRYYIESTNQTVGNTSSVLKTDLYMMAGDTLEFDYFVSSELDYDYFNFLVNGTLVLSDSGTDDGWEQFSYTATEAGTYTFEWRFDKDPAAQEGEDVLRIDEIKCIRALDINGDGNLSGADALLVLRYSMDLCTMNDEQIERADVDDSGSVTALDALIILRAIFELDQ
ncbi:MAG: S8 family serine peptidase [Clostridia bacterium]|nr:S8 family serine peptidase [Clostridia bacterium]